MVVLLEKTDDPAKELGSRITGVSTMDLVSAYKIKRTASAELARTNGAVM
jgi:hypothetical protein